MEVKMKGLFVVLFILVFIGCATVDNVREFRNLDLAIGQSCQNIQSDFNEKTSIAIFNIIAPSARLSEYIMEEAMNGFTNMHRYNVVERNKISAILQEQNFQTSGNVSDDTMQRIGNMLGAQFVVTGALDDVGSYYRLRLFVIAVESGERKSSTAVNIIKPNEQIAYLSGNSLKENDETKKIEEAEKIIIGKASITAEIERLLSDVNSPETVVWGIDIDAYGTAGAVFTTNLPEDIINYNPDFEFHAVKNSGKWMVENLNRYSSNDEVYTFESIIESVIGGLDGILILHIGRESYIYLWQ
jgi:TolB-like protein